MGTGPSHLFNSRCRAEVMVKSNVGGVAESAWVPAGTSAEEIAALSYIKGRFDLNFVRPGKDVLPAPVAGQAPDRVGLFFCGSDVPIKAGMRLVTVPNDNGKEPVKGIFEIRVIPDVAIDFSDAHHIEVQVIETQQSLDESNWPD